MGRNETPSWQDQPSEPEGNNHQADLPPWLRDDAAEAEETPAEESAAALPPWLQQPDEEREMLRGQQLSEEWLSSADALVESVDTELTYDEWQAIQQERARPKSIEEEVPDLLSDLPPAEEAASDQSHGVTGELPDWFLGLEELDTSDAPDWFVGGVEEPTPAPTPAEDAPPNWISDLEQEQAPQADDTIGKFFTTLNQSSTLPSGESLDDLFGEFAMAPPSDDELPDLESELDWTSEKPQASVNSEDYGASEMDDFFRSLSQTASGAAEPPESSGFEEEVPDSSALLSRVPKASEPADLPPLDDLDPFALEDLPEPELSAQVQPDDVDDIEEPDLEWFVEQPPSPASTALLPSIDTQPDIPEPTDEELSSPDTLNWLNELDSIVSSVAREEDESLPTADDFFPVEPEPPAATQAQDNIAGRGDEFDWPEPESYVEPETAEQPQNWFDQFNLPNVESEAEPDKPVTPPPPTTRLTGMLNRLREAEEARVQDVKPEEPTPDDDLESLFLTEELLAEAEQAQDAAPAVEDLFAEPAEAAQSTTDSEWGNLDLDDIISEASAAASSGEQAAEFGDLEDYSFDSLLDGAPAEQQPSAEAESDFNLEQTPAEAQTLGLTGLLSHVHLASPEEYQSQSDSESEIGSPESIEDLFGDAGLEEVTVDDLYPAEWDASPEQPESAYSAEEAVEFGTVGETAAEDVYEPQWGASEVEEPEAAYSAEEAIEFSTADETPASEDVYEPQWGAAEPEAEAEQEWEASLQPELGDLLGGDLAGEETGEDAEDFGDMSWLTDDIFAETGNIQPVEAEQSAAEPGGTAATGESEFTTFEIANAQFGENAPAESQAEETAAAEESLFGADYSASWETGEEEPTPAAELANDDFLEELRREQAPITDETADDEDFAILWGADEEAPEIEAEAVPAEDDFLQMLQPQAETPSAPAEPAGFDDDFLASLDTLDQMQASGQSHVGDDLFPTLLEEQPEATSGDALEPVSIDAESDAVDESLLASVTEAEAEADFDLPDDEDNLDWLTADLDEEPEQVDESFGAVAAEQPQAELDDDFFASLDAQRTLQSSVQTSDLDFLDELSTESAGSEQAAPAEFEQPEFGEDFFALLNDEETPPAAEPEVPDLFASLGDETPAAEDDFFREMGLSEPTAEAQPAEDMDWLTDLGTEQPPHDEGDPFGVFESAVPVSADEPDWLKVLTKPESEADELEPEPSAVDDWFADYAAQNTVDESDSEQEELPEVGPIEDLDSYLASLTGKEAQLRPGTKELLAQEEFDIDTLFEEPLLEEDLPPASVQQPQPFGDAPESGMTPDWLTDVNVGEVSAGAIVRQRKDRPEGELDDRLKKLRKRGDKVPAASAAAGVDDPLSDVLPDVEDTLAPATIRAGAPSLIGTVSLSSGQQERVALLKTLVNTAVEDEPAPKRLSAIEMTYDDAPYQLDLEEEGAAVVQPERQAKSAPSRAKSRRAARVRPRIRLDRLLITLLLAGGIIAPFLLPGLRVGTLPAPAFVAGSSQEEAYNQLDDIDPGTLVLFAVEYSPAAAAELDPMTDALLRHALLQNAYPVIISGNPVALLRAGNLLDSINADEDFLSRIGVRRGLQPNRDYYVVRYIPGSTIGLRAFSADTARMLLSDIRGQTTGLNVLSLRDFPVIVVVSDRAEDVRSYAEQVAPLARASVIAAISYSAAPLVEPYVNAEILSGPPALSGLLVGYGDAYTYNTLIGNVSPVQRTSRRAEPIIRTTPEPSPTPTPTATPRFTPTPSALGSAVVTAGQTVNVRPEPNTNNAPIGQLRPGDEVEVLGFNDDRSWVSIRLEDGREGWVSAQLVDVSEAQSALPKGDLAAKQPSSLAHSPATFGCVGEGCKVPRPEGEGFRVRAFSKTVRVASPILQDDDATETPDDEGATEEAAPTRRPTRTPRATATPRSSRADAEVTSESTAEATADAGQIVLPPHSPGYRDERWYAMTMGIIVSAVVISLGAIINIVRSILRRRR